MVVVTALAAGALGGVLSSRALREAHAQSAASIVVPVPPDGVVFRSPFGNAVARVRSGPAGGSIEVLDARERVAVRLRATNQGGVIELGTSQTAVESAAPSRPVLPLVRSMEDPGY